MISRSHRFHGRGSLKYVYQRGQTIRGNQITLRFVTNDRRQDYRAAVIVSRKVHKSAVVRNRIRRRIYSCLQTETALQGKPALDCIITVFHDQLATMPAPELQRLVHDLVSRTRVVSSSASSA
jgi:ribonuclease P protein component